MKKILILLLMVIVLGACSTNDANVEVEGNGETVEIPNVEEMTEEEMKVIADDLYNQAAGTYKANNEEEFWEMNESVYYDLNSKPAMKEKISNGGRLSRDINNYSDGWVEVLNSTSKSISETKFTHKGSSVVYIEGKNGYIMDLEREFEFVVVFAKEDGRFKIENFKPTNTNVEEGSVEIINSKTEELEPLVSVARSKVVRYQEIFLATTNGNEFETLIEELWIPELAEQINSEPYVNRSMHKILVDFKEEDIEVTDRGFSYTAKTELQSVDNVGAERTVPWEVTIKFAETEKGDYKIYDMIKKE